MCNLANRQYWTEKGYERARALFEEASKSGNEHAFYGLAEIYYKGLGVEKDVRKAWEYLEKAINKGDAESRDLLATMGLNNDLQDILSDKVCRASCYLDMGNFPPGLYE